MSVGQASFSSRCGDGLPLESASPEPLFAIGMASPSKGSGRTIIVPNIALFHAINVFGILPVEPELTSFVRLFNGTTIRIRSFIEYC